MDHTGRIYVLTLFLFVHGVWGHGSGEPASPVAKTNPQSGAPRISIIQAPASVRDRVRIDTIAAHMVPEVVTAPGEVALDLSRWPRLRLGLKGK